MDVDNIQAVIDAAREGVHLVTLDESSHHKVVYSSKHGLQTVDLAPYQAHPAHKSGHVKVFDAVSFSTFLEENAVPDRTTIYIDRDPQKPAVVAVIDGNGKGGPGYGRFRASIAFRPMPQWVKWCAIDGKFMPQETFAEFVEDNLEDIVDPPGAEMLEIVTSFQATRSLDFKSAVRLSNGQVQFIHLETTDAVVKSGEIKCPETFNIGISPFFGVTAFKIQARFRYRINDRKLSLGFKLQRPEGVMEQVMDDIEKAIQPPPGVITVHGTAP